MGLYTYPPRKNKAAKPAPLRNKVFTDKDDAEQYAREHDGRIEPVFGGKWRVEYHD